MDVSQKISAVKAEPLKLQDKLTEDWIQPFACKHVVVDIASEQAFKDRSDGTSIQTSYCVMCGELVAENPSAEKENVTLDYIRHEKRKKKGHDTRSKHDDSFENPHTFASSRRTGSSLSFSGSTGTRACTIHGHKKIKYFCEDHQEVCCSVCVNVLHRGCERIMFIKDEIHGGWSSKICEETITALDAISNSFRYIQDYNESIRQKLNTEVLEFRKRRDEFRARILRLLDDFEKSSEKLVNRFIKICSGEIECTLDICRNVLRETETNSEILEKVIKSSSMDETFIATQKVLLQREKYGVALSDAIRRSKDVSIELIPATNIETMEDLKKVAEVQFISEAVQLPESVISAVSKIPKSELRSPRTTRDARSESCSSLKNPASFIGKFNVRLPEDKETCENVGAVFLTDGRVAIVDMKNCKLKVFDIKFTKACALQLSSEPRDVAVISPQEVAVSLPDESKIQIISTGKKIKATRSILTNLPCYGITCHNQELIVLCDDGFSTKAIQMIDLEGNVLKTLTMNKSGRELLKNPWNITTSVDGQQICVTDKGRLVNFDVKGNILFEYAESELENARGLSLDDSGRIYVCGTSSNNVHQVSADGKRLSIILTEEEVTAPQAVCYQFGKRYLLLTCAGNDNIFMYKLAKT